MRLFPRCLLPLSQRMACQISERLPRPPDQNQGSLRLESVGKRLTSVEYCKITCSTLLVMSSSIAKMVGTIGSAPDFNRSCRISKLALSSSGESTAVLKSRPRYCSRRHLRDKCQSHSSRASILPSVDPLTHYFRGSPCVPQVHLCQLRDQLGIDKYSAVYTMSRTCRLLRKQSRMGTR